MESKDKLTESVSINPIFYLDDYYYIEEKEFEKDVIYIDIRENDNTLNAFIDFIHENTERDSNGFNKHYDNQCRLKLTGGRYLPYITWRRVKLPVGDFMYNGIVFELKRGYDLYDSITGEIPRLDKQIDHANKLLRKGEIKHYQVFCTMEGDFVGDKFNEFNYFNSQEGLIVSQYYGIEQCIKAIFNSWNTSTRLKSLRTNYIPETNPAYLQLYALNSCSPKNAMDIYHKFLPFHIDDLDELTEKKLMEVKGIGPKKAHEIYTDLQRVLHRPKNVSSRIIYTGEVNVY